MQSLDEIKSYSAAVCEQIRWKKARPGIARELEDHICDQRDYYLAEGEEEDLATRKAVLQMGDAVSVGLEMDKIYRPKPQWVLLLLTAALIVTGSAARYFLSVQNPFGMVSRNSDFVPTVIAIGILLTAYFLDFTALAKHPGLCYFLTLFMGIAGLILRSQVNGRRWWISIAGFSFSLPYLALIFPLVYALMIYAMRNRGRLGILQCAIAYIPFAVILLLLPTATGFAIYTFSAWILLFLAMRKGWFGCSRRQSQLLGAALTAALVLCLLAMLLEPYRFERLRILINPDAHLHGYMTVMVRDLMSGSVFSGSGTIPRQYGDSLLSGPLFDTDLMLTALTHSYGWIVFAGIVLLFIVFSALGFLYASRQKSMLGTLVSLSILLIFAGQTVVYVAANLGYGLLTAMSLPLVSYGKASLFLNAALIGIMLSVFRSGDVIRDGGETDRKSRQIVKMEDGKLVINLRG